MPLHLNKEHVLFQVERPQEAIKTYFLVTTKEKAKQSSNRHFWNVLNAFLETWCFASGENGRYFLEGLCENHQNNCTQYKTTETTFLKKSKAVFLSIRYRKTSQTQDVKSQSTKRSLRELAQPKRNSAFDQKTRIVSSREFSGSSQNRFLSYNQTKSPVEVKKTILERTQRRFGKFVFSFPWDRPLFFRRFVLKTSKQLHTIQNDKDHISEKIKSSFYKYSVSQDISNAGCKEPKYRT